MTNIKAIQGVTNIYDSSEAKDFNRPMGFPIAWEVIYLNNDTGKEFTSRFKDAIKNIAEDKYQILEVQGKNSDLTRCIECAFSDVDSFKKVLKESFQDFAFYSEIDKKITPRTMMVDDAKKVSQRLEASNLSL